MSNTLYELLLLFVRLMVPVALVLFLALIVVAARSRRTAHPGPTDSSGKASVSTAELPYQRQRHLLTPAEREFFAVLRVAAPEGWYVFPQVRLANLVIVKKGTRNWKPHFSRVAQKCVDFVLCDAADIGPRLVVELDDSSHDRPDRQDRDRFVDAALGAAGLSILHVRWQRQYDATTLAGQIRAAAGLPPALPQVSVPTFAPPISSPAGLSPRAARAAELSRGVAGPVQRWACRSCNAEVSANAKFCTACGAQLEL